MVFTDGEEFGDWSELDQIPTKIKRDIVFVLVNDEYTLRKIMSQLSDRGIKKQNIIPIDKKLYL
ncbi:hypothetical protein J6O48_01820 [bacterium]|nr:hypothetical protein [bacterium]